MPTFSFTYWILSSTSFYPTLFHTVYLFTISEWNFISFVCSRNTRLYKRYLPALVEIWTCRTEDNWWGSGRTQHTDPHISVLGWKRKSVLSLKYFENKYTWIYKCSELLLEFFTYNMKSFLANILPEVSDETGALLVYSCFIIYKSFSHRPTSIEHAELLGM